MSKRFVVMTMVFIIAFLVSVNSYAQMLWGRCEREALAKLEISQVEVSSWLSEEKSKQLYNRIIKQLAEAGIHPKRSTPIALGYPTLRLTFDAIDLGEGGPNALYGNTLPGKFLYRQKLEVWEYLYKKQDSEKPIEAVTCTIPIKLPMVVNNVSDEQIEADLRELLEKFILVYKYANPGKK